MFPRSPSQVSKEYNNTTENATTNLWRFTSPSKMEDRPYLGNIQSKPTICNHW